MDKNILSSFYFYKIRVHINNNPSATEFNPSITQKDVANFFHWLQIVVFHSLTQTHTHIHGHAHTHSLMEDLLLAIFIWFRCIFISNSCMAAGCAVIRRPLLALVAYNRA